MKFFCAGAWSRPYIALGHPTKPFHVKGKSSDWGPQAGLVPLDSEFSKAFAAKDIQKGIQANQDALNGNYAKAIPLFLSEAFIRQHLTEPKGSAGNRPIDRITVPRAGVLYFFCTKPNDDPSLPGKRYVLFGKQDAFPLTTFHPRRGIGGYPFRNATITDYADLCEYFKTLYANGYYPPRNHAWHMPSLRNDDAVKAQLNQILMRGIPLR